MTNMSDVVRVLKSEHERLTNQLQGISAALSAFGAVYGKQNGAHGKISAAGRARIAEAQRQRWAKLKGLKGKERTDKEHCFRPKETNDVGCRSKENRSSPTAEMG